MRRKTLAQLARMRAAEHARLAKYRDDERTVTFEYSPQPLNTNGSLVFLMYWFDANHHLGARWCGQYYRTFDPDSHVRRWQEKGFKVREVNRPGRTKD